MNTPEALAVEQKPGAIASESILAVPTPTKAKNAMAGQKRKKAGRLKSNQPTQEQPETVTFQELFEVSGIKFEQLRKLQRDFNPVTKLPWLPKSIKGRLPKWPALVGIAAYFRHRSEQIPGLPECFPSLKEMVAQSPFSREMVEYAIEHGAMIRNPNGTCNLSPLISFYRPKFARLIPTRLDDMQRPVDMDMEYQTVLGKKLDNEKKQREEKVANGELYQLAEIEKAVWDDLLGPLRQEIISIIRRFDQSRSTNPGMAAELIDRDLRGMFDKLRTRAFRI